MDRDFFEDGPRRLEDVLMRDESNRLSDRYQSQVDLINDSWRKDHSLFFLLPLHLLAFCLFAN